MPNSGISCEERMLKHWNMEMIKLKQITSGILILFWAMPGFSAIDEEQILQRKAALVAQKVHMRNMALVGIDPKTCKTTENKKLIISQLAQIKTGKLNHCPEYVQQKLKAIDEEIKNVENGVLVYAPVKAPTANISPVESIQESDPLPETNEYPEESIPAITTNPSSTEVDYTGLNEEQRSRILLFQEKNRDQYVNYEDDDLFLKLSNAYMRNLPRLMAKPKLPEKSE